MIRVISTAHQLFWKATSLTHLGAPSNLAAIESFKSAALHWREAKNHFSAGYAMSKAVMAAWGDDDTDKDLESLISLALQDFNKCVETNPAFSYESLSALSLWLNELHRIVPLNIADSFGVKRAISDLSAALAQRLVNHDENSTHLENYLVRNTTGK